LGDRPRGLQGVIVHVDEPHDLMTLLLVYVQEAPVRREGGDGWRRVETGGESSDATLKDTFFTARPPEEQKYVAEMLVDL